MLPAIVLSSHTVGLAVIRSLGKEGVPVYVVYFDNNDMGYVSKYVKKAFLVPDPETDESGFIKKLIEISEGIGPNILFPADDSTLLTVSRNKDILEKYGLVSCPNWGVIQT
jgi:predicted ATP-grasp superfamily ATP-dependent carboligase